MRKDHDPESEETELPVIIDESQATGDKEYLFHTPADSLISAAAGSDPVSETRIVEIKVEEIDVPDSLLLSSSASSSSVPSSSSTATQEQSNVFWGRLGTGPHIPRQPSGLTLSPRSDEEQSSGGSASYNRSGPSSFSSYSSSSVSSMTSMYSHPVNRPSPSLIHLDGSVYAAVPISSEVHIIPKSSRDFQWNGDLFLKPHQRRSLGIDHLFTSGINTNNSNRNSIISHFHPEPRSHSQEASFDASVTVHEIRLDDHETAGLQGAQRTLKRMTRLNLGTVAVALALTLLANLSSMAPSVEAIKFELQGQHFADALPHCISHYVDAETEVVVKVMVGRGAQQKVSVEVTDDSEHQNQLWSKDNLSEDLARTSFLTKHAGDIVACFTNVLSENVDPDPRYFRNIDVDFDIGSETTDYEELAKTEKLKPMEMELRKMEDMVKDIIENMEHLQQREETMRNTNESTNARVQWFSTLTMVILVTLGVWQIFYLKRFFRKKRLID
ncbi:vesicle coat component [Gryganskiella cystojenkinii]|nr:vesicle coat component [Gryganskiella cystojenkinii]